MQLKLTVVSLLFIIFILTACDQDGYKRNFSLSSVASFSGTAEELKNRWRFCNNCLSSAECRPDDIKGCNTITIPDRDEALNKAIGRANTEVVYFLIDVAKTDVNGVTGNYQETPLMVSAYYGTKKHQEIAKFLISHGANVNATRDFSPIDTALLTAIWKNNIDFAKLLLKHGADPSVTAMSKKEGNACKYAIRKGRIDFLPLIPGCCSLVINNPDLAPDVMYRCQ